jgi:dienelactone hydrolase
MAEVLLFHHALGCTDGVEAFAQVLRDAGHVVHVPDLFEGRTFDTIEAGVAHAAEIGFGTVVERGTAVAERLPAALVYVGFSLGVLPAQSLAQTRPGARAAVLFSSCLPPGELGPWPAGVPVQVHAMEDDPIFVGEGDLDAACALVAEADDAELFLYPGADHYFADPNLDTYHPLAAAEARRRVLDLLTRIDGPDGR